MNSEIGTVAQAIVDERRVGRFLVPHELVMRRPTDVVELLRDKIVIRCELLGCQGAYEYIAYGSCFAPVREGGLAPLYEVRVAVDCIGLVPFGQGLAPPVLPGRPATAMELLRKEELAAGGDFAYAAASGSADVGQKEARYRELQLAVEKAERWRTPVDDRNGGR